MTYEAVPVPPEAMDEGKCMLWSGIFDEDGLPTKLALKLSAIIRARKQPLTIHALFDAIMPVQVVLTSSHDTRDGIVPWLSENCADVWMAMPNGYRFANPHDAFAFKLKWG